MIEVDLRIYILAILRKWKWLVGFAVLTAVIAYISASLLPKTYTATAVVVTQQNKFVISFNNSIQNNRLTPPNKAILDLANSNEVLRQTFDASGLAAGGVMSFAAFKEQAAAKTGGDQSWITLSVSMEDPALAADLANLWAKFVVEEANRLYNPNDPAQLTVWQAQLDTAKSVLDSASQALVEFKAADQSGIISNRLQSLLNEQAELLTLQRVLSETANSVSVLQDQLRDLPEEASFTPGDTAVLFLQLQAYENMVVAGILPTSAGANAEAVVSRWYIASNGLSLNIQPDTTSKTVGEQRLMLDAISQTIAQRFALISERLVALESQILELQKQYQLAIIQKDQLAQAYDQASTVYSSLSSKYSEVQVASSVGDDIVQVVERAIPPARPENISNLVIALATMLVAVLLGVFLIVVPVWWRSVMAMKPEPAA